MSIGRNIYALRQEKGYTQLTLAEKLGVSVQAVSKWENDVCAPDVSLFPGLAELFGVSIDRLFGFRLGAEEEIQAIRVKADGFDSLEENIAFLLSSLEKYPNSPELKTDLAMSYLSAWRMGLGGVEKEEAREKCLRLCREVERSCGDRVQVDAALEIMSRVYRESGEYDRAQACLEKLSGEAYGMLVGGTAEILRLRGDHAALERYGAREILSLWGTLYRMLSNLSESLSAKGEKERALAFAQAGESMLSLFDGGCPDFFAFRKLMAAEKCASLRMDLGDRAGCLEDLRRVLSADELIRSAAGAGSHHIADRDPLFFSGLREDPQALEEWAPEFPFAPVFEKYKAFFGDDEEFQALLKETEKIGNSDNRGA